MAKNNLPDFDPELRIVARGAGSNRLVVVFDTNADIDLKRAPRVVMIDTEGVTSLTPSVGDLTVVDKTYSQSMQGQIKLLAQKGKDEVIEYLLADFDLEIEGGKPDKNGKFSFPTDAQIAQVIRQGVADAFTEASLDMANSEVMATLMPVLEQGQEPKPRQTLPSYPFPGGAPRHAMGASSSRGQAKPRWSGKMTAFVSVLVVLLLGAVFKIATTPADPIQAAVNKTLANDPVARNEQIEITRQTLKEMGLDPGKPGDLGCLASP